MREGGEKRPRDPQTSRAAEGDGEGRTWPTKVQVKLADGKERTIDSMVATSFWSADGKPMSAAQFLESLFGSLPALFKSEAELRTLWSLPDTRKALLDDLAERGFSRDALAEMQKVVSAENSDIFDVLAYVAFATAPLTREVRATNADKEVRSTLSDKQRDFIAFVLQHYVNEGVDQLDTEKLAPLLRLKYGSVQDGTRALGAPAEIRKIFVGFQRYLYSDRTAA